MKHYVVRDLAATLETFCKHRCGSSSLDSAKANHTAPLI